MLGYGPILGLLMSFFQAWLLFGTIPASIVCCLRHFCLHLSLHLLHWWWMEKKVNMFILQNSPNNCLQSFESVKTVTIFKWFCQESAFMLLAPFVLLSGMTKFAIFLRRSNYSVMHNKWRQINFSCFSPMFMYMGSKLWFLLWNIWKPPVRYIYWKSNFLLKQKRFGQMISILPRKWFEF